MYLVFVELELPLPLEPEPLFDDEVELDLDPPDDECEEEEVEEEEVDDELSVEEVDEEVEPEVEAEVDFFLVATVTFLVTLLTLVPPAVVALDVAELDPPVADEPFAEPSTTTVSCTDGAGAALASVVGAADSVICTSLAASEVVASPTVASARA